MDIAAIVFIGLALISIIYAIIGYIASLANPESNEQIIVYRTESIIFILFGIFLLLLLSQIDKVKFW
jgi:hypothetical protein